MPTILRHSTALPYALSPLPHLTTKLSAALVRALLPFDLVIVPGLFGSGEDHWQSIWASLFQAHGVSVRRVEQDDWENPTPAAWHERLHQTLAASRKPVLLIAHSLGAILSARHASNATSRNMYGTSSVVGALLVAPADAANHTGPDAARIEGFMPPPSQKLPFPATLVFSQNDPWLEVNRAHQLAKNWGASLLDAGYAGHIGQDANVEHWPLGLNALHALALTCHATQAFSRT
ncbi:RBBP9/YdeN family alpha/beta hydrolase [Acetobacter cibinongensis]|uniref:RBBP9/YdeN family alpha/beta hydrolase n=1 Tax=Acetobacter cibinongensis TaxID=146475 RepID=UPI000A373179|nr:alpha/beta fold hydrolase [Acetobacter cibinongensis]